MVLNVCIVFVVTQHVNKVELLFNQGREFYSVKLLMKILLLD